MLMAAALLDGTKLSLPLIVSSLISNQNVGRKEISTSKNLAAPPHSREDLKNGFQPKDQSLPLDLDFSKLTKVERAMRECYGVVPR